MYTRIVCPVHGLCTVCTLVIILPSMLQEAVCGWPFARLAWVSPGDGILVVMVNVREASEKGREGEKVRYSSYIDFYRV